MPRLELLEDLFDALPVGLVVLDARGHVVVYNRAEERLARRAKEDVVGKAFFSEVAPCLNVRELGGAFHEGIGRTPIDARIECSFPFPFLEQPRDVTVQMRSFDAGGAAYAMLVIEDVSVRRSVERMKDLLANLLVHDLKNPLSVILANLGFLRRAELPDARHATALELAIGSARRLQSMLVNLLDVTRLETQTFPLRRRHCDVAPLVAEAALSAAALGRDVGVEVVREVPPTLPASVDPDVVRRLLENLAENAVRHARRRVVLRGALTERGDLVLEVEDDGPGVNDADRERIFEKYVQVGAPAPTHNRGLGLTFVRLAAGAHGGGVEVESAAPTGARFRVTLPVAMDVTGP